MKRFAALMLAVLLLIAVAGCSKIPAESTITTTPAAQEDKTLAPDFTVYDAEGKAYKLSDFRGKPVVLNFWASWCPPCKAEMPDFQKEFEAQGKDVQFLIINLTDGMQETVDTASAYVAQQGYTFPVFYDTSSAAANAYGIRSIPTTFFIDAEGYAVAQATGAIDRATLQKGIDMILPKSE